MTIRRKQTYLGVVLVGLAALAVDRWILPRGPAPAVASLDVPLESVRSILPGATAERDQSIPEVPFPRGLSAMDIEVGIRDLFARTDRPPTADDASPDNLAGADGRLRKLSLCDTFAAGHRLDAVLQNDGLRIAVVNGHWLRPGDTVDGCRFVALEGTQARFECADGCTTLDLKKAAGDP